jgi:hypothetical protein
MRHNSAKHHKASPTLTFALVLRTSHPRVTFLDADHVFLQNLAHVLPHGAQPSHRGDRATGSHNRGSPTLWEGSSSRPKPPGPACIRCHGAVLFSACSSETTVVCGKRASVLPGCNAFLTGPDADSLAYPWVPTSLLTLYRSDFVCEAQDSMSKHLVHSTSSGGPDTGRQHLVLGLGLIQGGDQWREDQAATPQPDIKLQAFAHLSHCAPELGALL